MWVWKGSVASRAEQMSAEQEYNSVDYSYGDGSVLVPSRLNNFQFMGRWVLAWTGQRFQITFELFKAQIGPYKLCLKFWDGSQTGTCQISASETGAMFWALSYRFEVLIRRASVWDPSHKIKHNLLDPIWASESSEAIQTLRSDQASTLHPMNKKEFCRNCVSVWIALCEWLSELILCFALSCSIGNAAVNSSHSFAALLPRPHSALLGGNSHTYFWLRCTCTPKMWCEFP